MRTVCLLAGRDCGLGVDAWKDVCGSPMYTQSSKNTITNISPTTAAWSLLAASGATQQLLMLGQGPELSSQHNVGTPRGLPSLANHTPQSQGERGVVCKTYPPLHSTTSQLHYVVYSMECNIASGTPSCLMMQK